ncbi:MAG TPA: baseplate J/gp47 family protein [Rhodocyclaceae bacterium]
MATVNFKDGTSQEDRLISALSEGYVDVAELGFADLLAFAGEFSGLLKRGDGSDGDWKAFFQSDEAAIIADILATNVKLREAEFSHLVADPAVDIAASLRQGRVAIEALPAFALAAKIDQWLQSLGHLPSVAAVRAQERLVDLVTKSLATELQSLQAFLRRIDHDGAARAFAGFDPQWKLGQASTTPVEDAQAAAFLRANFQVFRNAVLFLQDGATELLSLSLGRRDHDPAMGLFIAFLQLFAKAQDQLNEFTRNHRNFYYRDVLRIARSDWVPDSAHLVLTPDVAGREVAIAKGTEFRAGLDENKIERIYVADDELLVTDAVVRSLITVYLERDALISPENALCCKPGDDARFVTAIKLNRDWTADGAGDKGAAPGIARPLFGDPQRHGKNLLFEDARVGFAVASNVLLLGQGQRDIDLGFRLEATDGAATVRPFVSRLSEILETTEADAFFKAFRHMFEISLTAEHGWHDIDEYLPLCSLVDAACEEDSFKLRLRLPDSAPAIVGYQPQIHGAGFDTELPMVRCRINPGAYLYSYSLLREMIVREIVIEAKVTGCNSVLVSNQLGPLSRDAQFAPFGTLPAPGDFLVLGCHEAAQKRLAAFEVDVEWGGLPSDPSGFEGHYRSYPMAFGNGEFKVRLGVLRDRKWIPDDAQELPETDLFDSAEEANHQGDAKVSAKRRFSFSGLCPLMRPLERVAEDQYSYSADTKDGFFRLTLSGPDYGFGHKEYPMALSQIIGENAQAKRFGLARLLLRNKATKELPNQPYTPLVNSISVNYRAISTLSLEHLGSADDQAGQERLFHLHPTGQEAVSNARGRIRLVPPWDADGNLLIGISAGRLDGPLALLFHLRQDSLPEAGQRSAGFTWQYLSSNEWKRLDETRVLGDGTNGFLTSGIVTLDIPADIDRNNSILPADLFWLRVSSTDRHLGALCSLYGVYTNGLKVTWQRQEGNGTAHLAEKLPAGSIKEPKSTIVGLEKIRQIMDSFGGMPAESEQRWTIRVSERLKHKNRAVTAWDYERLVIQRFPEIHKVKCFSNMSGKEEEAGRPQPGHVLLVVIPYPKEGAAVNSEPMANALLLRDVREYVQGLASPFAQIHVRNPLYERIQLRCKVKLRRGAEKGQCLNRLNQEIVEYLSPWNHWGRTAKFGWRIRCDEMQAHIQKLDYIESVTGVSLLLIRRSDDHHHRLADTARQARAEIGPSFPWGIAVPAERHLIEVVTERTALPPEKTGISDLEIGRSFILFGESK